MKRLFWVLTLIGIGAFGGYYGGSLATPSSDSNTTSSNPVRLQGDYHYVSPLLLCSGTPGSTSKRITDLEDTLEDSLRAQASEDVDVSVYFRDLITGEWVGVNENEEYAPSSMLKVPIAIAYFKAQEADPGIFTHEIHVEDAGINYNDVEHFKAEEEAEVGETYTVEELLKLMLQYSDNNAKILLDQLLVPDAKQEVYTDLGLSFPEGVGNEADFMSVQDYARFFRVLYNGTYLSADSSEELLSWLTQARFPYGISASIPASVPVSQKFGENAVDQNGMTFNELHDCGIVYYPDHPYVLCVMTKGPTSFDTLSGLIQSVSSMIYKKMEADFPQE